MGILNVTKLIFSNLIIICILGVSCRNNNNFQTDKKVLLPSYLFNKYSYSIEEFLKPSNTNDTVDFSEEVNFFEIEGQFEKKYFKSLYQEKIRVNIAQLQLDLPPYREMIINDIINFDTLLIYEPVSQDSIILYTTILKKIEKEENGKVMPFYADWENKILNSTPYFDYNWRAGDKNMLYGMNQYIPSSGKSLLKIDEMECFNIYNITDTYHSHGTATRYIPNIGLIQEEYDFKLNQLEKINDVPLVDYLEEKCEHYISIEQEMLKYK